MLISAQTLFGLCVIKQDSHMYAGPGLSYPKTSWNLRHYTPLRQIDSWENWYKVMDMEGDMHWVHQEAVNHQLYCMSVKVESATLRQGPGVYYPIIGKSEKYKAYRFLNRRDGWSQGISIDGEYIWARSTEVWVQ